MVVDIRKYSSELRELAENYYNQRIDFHEYRKQRKILLDNLEVILSDDGQARRDKIKLSGNENIMNKVLGLLSKNEKEVLSE